MQLYVIRGTVCFSSAATPRPPSRRPPTSVEGEGPPARGLAGARSSRSSTGSSDAMEKSAALPSCLTPENSGLSEGEIKRIEAVGWAAAPQALHLRPQGQGGRQPRAVLGRSSSSSPRRPTRPSGLGCGLAQATGVSLDGADPRRRAGPRRGPTPRTTGGLRRRGRQAGRAHADAAIVVLAVASKSSTQGSRSTCRGPRSPRSSWSCPTRPATSGSAASRSPTPS